LNNAILILLLLIEAHGGKQILAYGYFFSFPSLQFFSCLIFCLSVPFFLQIAMELCDKGSVLSTYEVSKRGLNEEQLSYVVRNMLEGLAYLHATKKIHRDVKAGNILLTSSGGVKIADFGVSAALQRTIQKQNTTIGSPYWMAPEVIASDPYNSKADVWSLGITVIEMVDGKPPLAEVLPFRALIQIPSKPPPTLRHPENSSPELNDFIAKCLAKVPEERWDCARLLTHPFIVKFKDLPGDVLFPLLEYVAECKKKKQAEKEALHAKLAGAAAQQEAAEKAAAKKQAPKADAKAAPKPPAAAAAAAPDAADEESEWEDENEEEGDGTMIISKSAYQAKAKAAAAKADQS
jgi:serine/threonine protein kinase